ncbi:MAG: hypothetical protein K1Y36_26095 [Blastocatellia bacterium]|nr:hypothetical protein [Blastocatellia bacterium]
MLPIQLDFTTERSVFADEKGNRQIRLEVLVDEGDLFFAHGIERRLPEFPSLQTRLIATVRGYFEDAENTLLQAAPKSDIPAAVQIETDIPVPEPIAAVPAKKTRRPRQKPKVKVEPVEPKRRGRPRRTIPTSSEEANRPTSSATNQTQQTLPGMPKLLKKKSV